MLIFIGLKDRRPGVEIRGISAAILGAGSWGTALAWHLAGKGYRVKLGVHNPELAKTIAAKRENPVYLPGVRLEDTVEVVDLAVEGLAGVDTVVVAVPVKYLREVLCRLGSRRWKEPFGCLPPKV